MEPVGVVDREGAVSPRLVRGLRGESMTAGPDSGRQRVHVLGGLAPDPEADALLAVARRGPDSLRFAAAAPAFPRAPFLERSAVRRILLPAIGHSFQRELTTHLIQPRLAPR